LFAFAPQISVADSTEKLLFYVKQKLFKLKEDITIFADEKQSLPIYSIKADRIIDFSAAYHFTDLNNSANLGSVKRRGMRSIWRAHYDIFAENNETPVMTIREKNPWIKVLDGFFGEIPIIGMFTGFVFNPEYIVSRPDGTVVMRLEKIPTFLSRVFTIKQIDQLNDTEELRVLLSLVMMLLLERLRG
ncbi:MAG TPA: hypothetical protein V6C58_06625, partial [Allocoleopsis sp.]